MRARISSYRRLMNNSAPFWFWIFSMRQAQYLNSGVRLFGSRTDVVSSLQAPIHHW